MTPPGAQSPEPRGFAEPRQYAEQHRFATPRRFAPLCAAMLLCVLCTAPAAAAAPKLTVKSTAGGDRDSVGDWDVYAHTRETDVNGDTVCANVFAFGDRLQVDYESAPVTARARLELLYHSADDGVPAFLVVPSGFVSVSPIAPLSIIAGTSFYKQLAIPSGYLAAADDTTKYGRLLTDSLGYEGCLGTDSVAVLTNGLAAGVTGSWQFGGDGQYYLTAAAGGTFCFGDDAALALDVGVNGGIASVADFGVTAHDVLDDDRKFGVFAGLTAVPHLTLNAGFYYNFTAADYLPEARVTRSGVDEFKKQSTKYALGISGGYEFPGMGLGVYVDFITGLTNEYIGKVKYYDSDGNLIDTEVTTIIRGSTPVKYKNGAPKRTDGFTATAVPLYSQLRLSYQVTDSVQADCNLAVRTMIRDSSQTWFTVYPRCSVALPQKAGTVGAGLRLDMNMTRYSGISGVAIPLTYTYKFKKKFK